MNPLCHFRVKSSVTTLYLQCEETMGNSSRVSLLEVARAPGGAAVPVPTAATKFKLGNPLWAHDTMHAGPSSFLRPFHHLLSLRAAPCSARSASSMKIHIPNWLFSVVILRSYLKFGLEIRADDVAQTHGGAELICAVLTHFQPQKSTPLGRDSMAAQII